MFGNSWGIKAPKGNTALNTKLRALTPWGVPLSMGWLPPPQWGMYIQMHHPVTCLKTLQIERRAVRQASDACCFWRRRYPSRLTTPSDTATVVRRCGPSRPGCGCHRKEKPAPRWPTLRHCSVAEDRLATALARWRCASPNTAASSRNA